MLICLFIFRERERDKDRGTETASGGRVERRRERIPRRLHDVSTEPNVGLELTNSEVMT